MVVDDRTREVRPGKLEPETMKVVWRCGRATVHEVAQALPRAHRRAYSTALTKMRKLERKGYLEHEERGRAYVYRPIISHREVRRRLLADPVERVFDGSVSAAVRRLMGHKKSSRGEVAELRRLVSEGRKGDAYPR